MIKKFQNTDSTWGNDYEIGRWTIRMVEIMTQQRSNDEVDLFLEERLQIHGVRSYLVNRYVDNKAFDKAVKLLKEGIEVDSESPGLVSKYEHKLKDIYKLTGDDEAYEEALWSLLTDKPWQALEQFNELKEFYPADEWEKQRELAFEKLAPLPHANLAPLFLSEKMYDRLLQDVLESGRIDRIQEYEDILKPMYPQELLDQYEKLIHFKAKSASNRGQYRAVVRDLKAMKKYPGGEEVVRQIVEDWQSVYNRRPAMIDELSKL